MKIIPVREKLLNLYALPAGEPDDPVCRMAQELLAWRAIGQRIADTSLVVVPAQFKLIKDWSAQVLNGDLP